MKVVLLPTCGLADARWREESPRTITQFSQSYPRTSAAARETAAYEYVPRFPTPQWMCSLPSGVIRTSPSWPLIPAEWKAWPTATPVTFDPRRTPLRASRSSHPNLRAPRSSASRRCALVTGPWLPP